MFVGPRVPCHHSQTRMSSKLDRTPSVERVSSLAEVVEIILSFLPAKALFMCAQVCRLWRDTARRIIRSRQRLGWLSFVAHHQIHGTPCTSKVREAEVISLETKEVIKWGAKQFPSNSHNTRK